MREAVQPDPSSAGIERGPHDIDGAVTQGGAGIEVQRPRPALSLESLVGRPGREGCLQSVIGSRSGLAADGRGPGARKGAGASRATVTVGWEEGVLGDAGLDALKCVFDGGYVTVGGSGEARFARVSGTETIVGCFEIT